MEDKKPSLSESHTSSSSLEEQADSISVSMARQRTILQVLIAIAGTDSIYHLLFIIFLFYSPCFVLPPATLSAKWHAVHSNLDDVLVVEIVIFAAVVVVRQLVGACEAVRVEGRWVRAEERGARRVFWFLLLLGNVVIAMHFVFWPVICRSCGDYGGGWRFVCFDEVSG